MDGAKSRVRDAGGDILACLGFFTRLPLRVPDTGRPFAQALWAAPVAGAFVGLAAGLALVAALRLVLPAGAAAAAALGLGILLTGALHEDGLADVADGFGGGGDRARKLEIMRDSRIGTYGTLALGLSLLARWSALAALAASASGAALVLAPVAAHAASRALLPAFMAKVPAARSDGVSAGVGTVGQGSALAALVIGAVLLLAAGFGFALAAAVVLVLVFLAFDQLCRRQIGGQTGDVLGALQQAGETGVLCAATALLI